MIGPQFPDEPAPRASDRTLRQFAALCILILGGLFALSWYRHHGSPSVSAWIGLSLALLAGLPGLFHVAWIRPVFLAASALTRPIGQATGMLLLALLYFGFITPLAWLLRRTGRDSLERPRATSSTYWSPVVEPDYVCRYVYQYQKQRGSAFAPQTGASHGSVESPTR